MEKKVEIIGRKRIYDGFFQLDEVHLRYSRYDGRMSEEMSRLIFERGDSVAVLLYHRARGTVLLAEQFRLPAYLRGDDGWLLEIVAGIQEPGKEAAAVAHREVLEEAGYRLAQLTPLLTFYVSPGACTERIHLYLGELEGAEQVGSGGGADADEDIRLHEIPLSEALALIARGEIRDAKTIIALQHLALYESASRTFRGPKPDAPASGSGT